MPIGGPNSTPIDNKNVRWSNGIWAPCLGADDGADESMSPQFGITPNRLVACFPSRKISSLSHHCIRSPPSRGRIARYQIGEDQSGECGFCLCSSNLRRQTLLATQGLAVPQERGSLVGRSLGPFAPVEPISERAWPFRRKRPLSLRTLQQPGENQGIGTSLEDFMMPELCRRPPLKCLPHRPMIASRLRLPLLKL